MSIQGLDVELLGDRFAKAVDLYGRMGAARDAAIRGVNDAGVQMGSARAKDIDALAKAQLAGKPQGTPEFERKAIAARDDAQLRLGAAKRAYEMAREALITDVHEHREEYETALEQRAKATSQSALNVLKELEKHLHDLDRLRAHQRWVRQPAKGEATEIRGPRIIDSEVGMLVNGVRDLVSGETPPSTQADWGIPVGVVPDDGMAYTMRGKPADSDAAKLRPGGAAVQTRFIEEQLVTS